MNPGAIILISVASAILLLSVIYCFLAAPNLKRRKRALEFSKVKYAHRGLHNGTRAENSLSAFAAAVDAGYGIELDVRLCSDGELVVFHDATLDRVVGREGRVIDFTREELAAMSLSGTADGIPTLRQVLDLIDGAVPMLIEIKQGSGESGIAEKFIEVIGGYKGEYIVESFHPIALRIVKKARPDILRGILSYEYMKDERYKGKLIFRLSQNLALNFLSRPDFISYDHNGYSVPKLRLVHRIFKTPLIAWTVRSQEEENAAREHGFSAVIFENYIPER